MNMQVFDQRKHIADPLSFNLLTSCCKMNAIVLLILAGFVSLSKAETAAEKNIKAIRKFYIDVAEQVSQNAGPTSVVFNDTYYRNKMYRYNEDPGDTKIDIGNCMSFADMWFNTAVPNEETPMCEVFVAYKHAYYWLRFLDTLVRGFRRNVGRRSMVAELNIITKPLHDLYLLMNATSRQYKSNDMMTLMDYSINGNNKDKGKYLSRRKFNTEAGCCYGVASVDTWERHYFWYEDAIKPIHFASITPAQPLALAHYGAFLSDGNVYVTWQAHEMRSWERYQVAAACPYSAFPGYPRNKKTFGKQKKIGFAGAVNYEFNNLHYGDLLVIQSQRDQTYFHLNNDGTMTTTVKNNSWFVMLNENGDIPAVPVWTKKKKIAKVQRKIKVKEPM